MSALTFALSLNILLSLFAALVEALIGYPSWVYKSIRHPVVWMGALIAFLDRKLNQTSFTPRQQKYYGCLTVFLCSLCAISAGYIVQSLFFQYFHTILAILLCGLVASSLPASRSLYTHFSNVQNALEGALSLKEARQALSHIVGRDTTLLDKPAIIRAAIESLAENFSDGVTAPLLWGIFGGLPGMCFYKTINTADSMIGHLNKKYRSFGWAAAKLDDLINWPASRLSALWLILAAFSFYPSLGISSLKTTRNFARKHRSPNAGWPESAMAGALKLRLAGPRIYNGQTVKDSWLGNFEREATQNDMILAARLFKRACWLQIILLYGLSLLLVAIV